MKLPDQRVSAEGGAFELTIERRPLFDTGLPSVLAAILAWLAVGLLVLGTGGWWTQALGMAAASLVAPSIFASVRRNPARWSSWGWRALDMLIDILAPVLLKALDVLIYTSLFMAVMSLCIMLGII